VFTHFAMVVNAKQMDLPLPKGSIGSRQAEESSRVPAAHIGDHHHTVVAGEYLKVLELKIGERRAQPYEIPSFTSDFGSRQSY
jgi:hypothetical protein